MVRVPVSLGLFPRKLLVLVYPVGNVENCRVHCGSSKCTKMSFLVGEVRTREPLTIKPRYSSKAAYASPLAGFVPRSSLSSVGLIHVAVPSVQYFRSYQSGIPSLSVSWGTT